MNNLHSNITIEEKYKLDNTNEKVKKPPFKFQDESIYEGEWIGEEKSGFGI